MCEFRAALMRCESLPPVLGSCSLSAGPPLTKSHSEGKFSDAEIEATIKAKLAKSKIGKEGFQVHVKDRVATWTGTTDDNAAQGRRNANGENRRRHSGAQQHQSFR